MSKQKAISIGIGMNRPFEQEQAGMSDRIMDFVIMLAACAVIAAILVGWIT